ncbi:Lipopolysaccharide biosynthesis regulator YciM, contains six TPR domains and a predicted metal-binding C-terminal domain [Pseudidiomarina indica]|uniref:Lipopolysaccharide assembly protein B n=1 Tax=Pseudidiomarina indica TaxID=1159017 RepID=A0A1G6A1E0_9GAMM|nr:lipopolysaccharide assembly protein LapB [Pseudidiomarina indica]SDB02261.1 Lipopolysaccharide biosynthesis regulator YciM, contains six TPR domains and a predicted metal-binding C-terminal domain [Pseudidiomarina indica]
MLELLFLLLPVAAAYGWFMGRNSVRNENRKEHEQFSRQYVTGLHLLLSDQPDKAVDLFIELLDVDSDTLETHWALGKLFRRRGELERAIKIHQNLTSRPTISDHERRQAMFELGLDYLAAGIYDRAEEMLLALQQDKQFSEACLRHLVELYESTHEWDKAIRVALKLLRYDASVGVVVAQLYCELAELQNESEQAEKFYLKARKYDPHCVRAALALGRMWYNQGAYRKAQAILIGILEDDPEFLSEALPLIKACYEEMDDLGGLIWFLQRGVKEAKSTTAAMMLSEMIAHENGLEAAEQFIQATLLENPTMRGFHKLMDFHIRTADMGKARDSLKMLQRMVQQQIQQRPKYRCRNCGFSGSTLYWQCPSCRTWGDIKPIIGLDGE